MFFGKQTIESQKIYEDYLKIVGSLSYLFSESKTPYLYYRIAEKIFCRSFHASDLSRGDLSADAMKDNVGIGLKTFLAGNNKTYQKVAEFNSDRSQYDTLPPEVLIKKISMLRNERIDFTMSVYGIDSMIYHCVVRDEGVYSLYEESMDKIAIDKIRHVKKNKGSITFTDTIHEYSFLISKSTLTKRFLTTSDPLCRFKVTMIDDPLEALKPILLLEKSHQDSPPYMGTIYLPLYGKDRVVYEKSGLNQWNAGGRKRDMSEVYIPIPMEIHHNFAGFFPNRDTPFVLQLPNGNTMKAKICQDGGKALMSYSNKELGQWLLRDVLHLREGELLTSEKLDILGVDSVRIDKIDDEHFTINFSKVGSYEIFKDNNFS